MACDCMKKLVDNINEKFPGKYPDLKAPTMLDFTTGKTQYFYNMTYRRKKKGDQLTEKRFDLPILFSHCPSCGIKIEK